MSALSTRFIEAAAAPLLGLRQIDPRRRDPLIEAMLHSVGLPPDARWSAAFIHHIGRKSHLELRTDVSDWPLPATGSCDDLARFAAERGILYEAPKPGDVALNCYTPTGEFIQAGFILDILETGYRDDDGRLPYYNCRTLEGNTDLTGGLDGPGAYRLLRTYVPDGGDRFIRWMELDPRRLPSEPTEPTETVMGRIQLKGAA